MSGPTTFYRTRFTIDVLSREPLEPMELAEVAYAVTDGGCVGSEAGFQGPSEPVDGPTAARLCREWNSDPDFLGLTESGEPSEVADEDSATG